MEKPKITLPELLELYPKLDTSTPFIVGIRGYYLNTKGEKGRNDLGIFDDAILFFDGEHLHNFNGNTDPSKSGLKLAMLLAGTYTYYKGKHRMQYNALRPHPEGVRMPCTRDGRIGLATGCNIHKGGEISTGSRGCQTIPKSQWDDFISIVYNTMDGKNMQTIKYYLYEKS